MIMRAAWCDRERAPEFVLTIWSKDAATPQPNSIKLALPAVKTINDEENNIRRDAAPKLDLGLDDLKPTKTKKYVDAKYHQ